MGLVAGCEPVSRPGAQHPKRTFFLGLDFFLDLLAQVWIGRCAFRGGHRSERGAAEEGTVDLGDVRLKRLESNKYLCQDDELAEGYCDSISTQVALVSLLPSVSATQSRQQKRQCMAKIRYAGLLLARDNENSTRPDRAERVPPPKVS